eukprot:TRINITY_DN2955_c0_g1_i1.p1 TRINITY_DN2955_c0_g1~~TRINITY_DN2955_c0_g1_i1.p1  ORF type:complete len:2138 (-),score=465.57 TRINITY_DN2955_c0_g1_i1:103-5628(-)
MAGTLQYMSPEETGRISRVVDRRTDFYSFGVVLYELLTGGVPFAETDMSALVYCHIAVKPVSPVEANANVPLPLSDIVMKLMAKDAEDRYQSAEGLEADLVRCLEMVESNSLPEQFPLGQADIGKFSIPQKMYGREKEQQTLNDALTGAVAGAFSLVLISGAVGVGKTTLVLELRREVIEKNGHFLYGKYDQSKRLAYGAFAQALQSHVRHLLGASEEELQIWRAMLLDGLGDNAQLIVDLVPEFSLLLGNVKLQPVPDPQPSRLTAAFASFIKSCASQQHPVVLFLDDLQWADEGSFLLLRELVRARDLTNILLVCSYRNDVDDKHPLVPFLRAILASGDARINPMELGPLPFRAVTQLVSDTLNCTEDQVLPLADFLFHRTEGNVFWLRSLLEYLQSEGSISLTRSTPQALPTWTWDLAALQQKDLPEGLTNMLAEKITHLSQNSLRVLQTASLLGSVFSVRDLAVVLKMEQAAVLEYVEQAVKQNVVLRVGDSRFRFSHNKLQEKVISALSAETLSLMHLAIGMALQRSCSSEEMDSNHQRLFEIVGHLCLGTQQLTAEPERERDTFSRLCLCAARAARKLAANQQAVYYLDCGIRCLNPNHWTSQYELGFQLNYELLSVLCLAGNTDRAQVVFNTLVARARTPEERVTAHVPLIGQCGVLEHHKQALELATSAFQLLGVTLPRPSDLDAALEDELRAASVWLRAHDLATLCDVPEPTVERQRLTQQVIAATLFAVFFAGDPRVRDFLVVKAFNLAVKYGPTRECASHCGAFGVILADLMGDYKTAEKCGSLGMQVCRKNNDNSGLCRSGVIACMFTKHWTAPFSMELEIAELAYQTGVESGELQFAGVASSLAVATQFYLGLPLPTIMDASQAHLKFFTDRQQQSSVGCHISTAILLVVSALASIAPERGWPDVAGVTREAFRRDCTSDMPLCVHLIAEAQLHYLQGEYDDALRILRDVTPRVHSSIPAFCAQAELSFYLALTLAEHLKPADISELEQDEDDDVDSLLTDDRPPSPPHTPPRRAAPPLDKVDMYQKLLDNQKLMRKWATTCPVNFYHKYLLVDAELGRIGWGAARPQPFCTVLGRYDKAISRCRRDKFTHVEAIANELAGKLCLSRGRELLARFYFAEAVRLYGVWGAVCKRGQMQRKYSVLLGLGVPAPLSPVCTPRTPSPRSFSPSSAPAPSLLSLTPPSSRTPSHLSPPSALTLGVGSTLTPPSISRCLSPRISEATQSMNRLSLAPPQNTVATTSCTRKEAEVGVAIDIPAIIYASQTISQELELQPLVQKIMQAIIIISAADKAAFLMASSGGVRVSAECGGKEGDAAEVEMPLDMPLASWTTGAANVVRYVCRTKETVVLGNASQDSRFGQDEYIHRAGVKSLVCLPITNQAELLGVLYLENNLTTDAFPKSRTELLHIFAAQVGVSLRNVEMLKIRARQDLYSKTLPPSVVGELERMGLLAEPNQYTQFFPKAIVMFADIVGFTMKCNAVDPAIPMRVLNQLFTEFDKLSKAANMEKIKTIGDAYMVASLGIAGDLGCTLETPASDLLDMVMLAVSMAKASKKVRFAGEQISMRFGLAVGPVLAGIIGLDKLQYDIIGSTVNLAARLEASGEPGKLHITDVVRQELVSCREYLTSPSTRGKLSFQPYPHNKGLVELKGFGAVATCFITPREVVKRTDTGANVAVVAAAASAAKGARQARAHAQDVRRHHSEEKLPNSTSSHHVVGLARSESQHTLSTQQQQPAAREQWIPAGAQVGSGVTHSVSHHVLACTGLVSHKKATFQSATSLSKPLATTVITGNGNAAAIAAAPASKHHHHAHGRHRGDSEPDRLVLPYIKPAQH